MKLVAVDIAGGELHPLLPGSYPRYSAQTGHLLFARLGSLWAAPFDPRALELLGPAVRIAEEVATDPVGGRVDYALGDDGTLIYRKGASLRQARLALIDDSGSRIVTSIPANDYPELALSPDGGRVVLVSFADADLWVYDLASGAGTRLALDDGFELSPVWAKDGRSLTFTTVSEKTTIYSMRADGSAPPERLGDAPVFFRPKAWVDQPPGVLGEVGIVSTARDIVLVRLEADAAAEPLRWLAYESGESGQTELYLRPFPDVTKGRWQISRGGGTEAEWDSGGERIYYRKGDLVLEVGVRLDAGGDVTIGEPRARWTVGAPPTRGDLDGKSFAVSPDRRSVVALVDATEGGAPSSDRLIVVKNFASELPRLAPKD
jgi:hypothetical protein